MSGGGLCPFTSDTGSTASRHNLAAYHNWAATHLKVSNRQMCGCTGFKSGASH